jgi:hypothetical protein
MENGKKKALSVLNLPELSTSWQKNAKLIAAWYIDTGEKLAKDGLSLREKLATSMKDTPLAKIVEARNALALRLVEDSANVARSFWQIDKENNLKKAEA